MVNTYQRRKKMSIIREAQDAPSNLPIASNNSGLYFSPRNHQVKKVLWGYDFLMLHRTREINRGT